jgi:pimeloyl-ACP methyl ester carboxylesterase
MALPRIAPAALPPFPLLCSLLVLVSCGDGGSVTEPGPPSVASVEVTPSSGSVHVGGTLQLTATPRDASGNAMSGQVVIWSSSNTSAVSVAPGGLVTGVDAGLATVMATSGGKTGAATVTVPSHTLEVSREGAGKGTVTSLPAGIDCGSACLGGFAAGKVVALTAFSAAGSAFAGWSGACTGTGSTCEVTMTGTKGVTAAFDTLIRPPPTYTVTVTMAGTGTGTVTSSPEGIHCGSVCSAAYDSGTVVTLTAAAASESEFLEWGGACTGGAPTCQVTVAEALAVDGIFVLSGAPTHRLTVWKSGTGDGTVTSSPGGIACGADCTEDFPEGLLVTLTASASSGSRFLGWTGACTSTEDTCRVSMGAARLVMAEFGTGPHVVSTVPENGATEVDPWIDALEFRFSEPMAFCTTFRNSGWWPYTVSWSSDRRTLFVVRGPPVAPLWGQRVMMEPMACSSLSGAPLESDVVLRFTTRFQRPPIRVAANPSKGFHWPYHLVLPAQVESPPTLLVEPNNTGIMSDDFQVHEESAKDLLSLRLPFAEDLGSPLLIPVFPLPAYQLYGGMYVHALDRYSLSNDFEGYRRIDLQMAAMMDDALDRLESMGYEMDRRVFMMGFSASGSFTNRFALLHPDRIKAAAPGSPGYGWPMSPVASWEGVPLKYPLGIMDLEALVGKAFDLAAFRSVPLYIYVGDEDTNGGWDLALRGMTEGERDQVTTFLNWPADPVRANRWPLARAVYESVGSIAQFVVYPGVGHTITPQMFEDIKAFFRAHR